MFGDITRVLRQGFATGTVAASLLANNFDVGCLRPFADHSGRILQSTMTANGRPVIEQLVGNADSTLRKDEWKILDQAVIRAAKPRLKAWGDLESAGLTFDIPNGLSKTVLQHQTQSDITDAIRSMDGLRESDRDRPVYDLTNLPLPITHKDFSFSAREISVSRNGSTPLDTTTAELAGRKVAESIEQLLLGLSSTYAYGGGTLYGYTNWTGRMTKALTLPTASGWTPATTVSEVLAMRTQSQLAYHYGPWMLYCGANWDTYMDDDYSAAKGDLTLRQRLRKIEGIQDVRTLDYLTTGYPLLLVQMTADVVRAVKGMQITTVQWESHGGMMLNFKVMCIMVPQLRADHNGNTGIVHGS